MAKKKKEEQPAEPEQKQRELPKVPKERNPLLTILTLLLVVVGIGELALWGYFGFSTVQVNRARRQYEAEQKAAAEERASRGTAYASAYGPRLKVKNGQGTWRIEDEDRLPAGGGTTSGTTASQGGGAQTDPSVRRIYMPKIPYALAQQETDTPAPVQGAEPLNEGDTTPA